MDRNNKTHLNIPVCALNRNAGTVRLKMEVNNNYYDECPESGCPDMANRTPGCAECYSNRLFSDYGESVKKKCRPSRSSSARIRSVNVCTTICLLLLFGCLSPRSSAAPHRKSMERQKRTTESENQLWGNPCDYNNSSSIPVYPPNYEKDIAEKLISQAKNAHTSTAQYKDTFALKLHSYSNFDELLVQWEKYEWLRKFDWLPEEGFPKEKVLYKPMSDDYMDIVMEQIDVVLPAMYKGLKMIVAGLYKFSEEGLNTSIFYVENLKISINDTMHDVRAVLCYFSHTIQARNLKIMPLYDSEVPNFTDEERYNNGLLLYRDTLNYLEYLGQVFQKMYNIKS